MGNTARLSYIACGIKKASADAGSKNIFVSFGKLYDDCLIMQKQLDCHGLPVSVADAAKAIDLLKGKTTYKGLYFCGVQPLARHDWIKRLHSKTGDLDFNVIAQSPDIKSLANILHIIKKIDFSFNLYSYKENPGALRDFIALSNFREIYLTIYTDGQTNQTDFLSLINMLYKINPCLQVALSGELSDRYYALACDSLKELTIVNTAIDLPNFYEIRGKDNEDTLNQ